MEFILIQKNMTTDKTGKIYNFTMQDTSGNFLPQQYACINIFNKKYYDNNFIKTLFKIVKEFGTLN